MTWTEAQPGGAANYNWRTGVCSNSGGILVVAALRIYLKGMPQEFVGGISAYPSPAANITFVRNSPPWIEQQPAGAIDRNWRMGMLDSDGNVKGAAVYSGRLYVESPLPSFFVCAGDVSAYPVPQSLYQFGSAFMVTGSISAYPAAAARYAHQPHNAFTNLWIYMLVRAARLMRKRRMKWQA